MFGTKIKNIDTRTREDNPNRIYFINDKIRLGFLDERVHEGLEEKYFELKCPLGKIKGAFCHTMDPSIHFSLAVAHKPYDTITGFYNASFPKIEDLKIKQTMKCSLDKQGEILQTIDFSSFFELGQCYRNSPEPYERLFINVGGISNFTLLHEKSLDKMKRSMLTRSEVIQKNSTIQMIEPVNITVSTKEKKTLSHFDYTNIELDKIYRILAEYDDGIPACLNHFHELLTFENLDLYQNMVSVCFPSMDQATASFITGVEKSSYQKNLTLVSKLNNQKQ